MREVETGMSFADAASKVIPQFVVLFEDLDGRLIAMALTLSS